MINDVVVKNDYFTNKIADNITKTPAERFSKIFENKNLKAQFLLDLT